MVQMNETRPCWYRHQFKRRAGALFALATILFFLTQPSGGVAVPPLPANTRLDSADKAFATLHYEVADSLYNALVVTLPGSSDLYWKLARLNISIAESIDPKEKALRLPYYTKAVEYAQKSVQLDESNASAHTWYAAALALKADKTGAKEKVKRAAEIKKELDRALELNPKDDVAWSMLGSYHFQISQMGWFNRFLGKTFIGDMPKGNLETAEKEFRTAISLNPKVIRHHHELALLCLADNRKEEALEILRTAETKPVLMKSDTRRLEEIRKLIRKLSKKLDKQD